MKMNIKLCLLRKNCITSQLPSKASEKVLRWSQSGQRAFSFLPDNRILDIICECHMTYLLYVSRDMHIRDLYVVTCQYALKIFRLHWSAPAIILQACTLTTELIISRQWSCRSFEFHDSVLF